MASDPTTRPLANPPRWLWIGVVASGSAWFALGFAEMFITWRACLHNEAFGNASSHPPATAAAFTVTFLLIGLAAAAGCLSYTYWRRFSGQRSMLRTDANDYREFVALVGVIVSFTLGIGMVWMGLPLFILRLCARVR